MLITDAAFSSHLNKAEIGRVFRNSSGDWLLGFTTTTKSLTPLERDVFALFKGLQIAVEQHLQTLEINVNADQLVTLLNTINVNTSSLVCDCRCLLHQLGDPKALHIYREQNRLADSLARMTTLTAQPFTNNTLF